MNRLRPNLPSPPALPRRQSASAWLVAAAVLGLSGSAFAQGTRPPGAQTGTQPTGQTAPAPAGQVEPLRIEVERLSAQLQSARAAQQQKEQLAAQGAAEIERLKGQPPSVPRDLALQERLAQAQVAATGLTEHAAIVRRLESELRLARQQLVAACDRALDSTTAPLPQAQRLVVLKLRTTQAEALAQAQAGPGSTAGSLSATAQVVRSALQSAAQAETGGSDAVLDDPQVLRERADLLRDSADKLKREVLRLRARRDELGRRQRLRERAVRVDEDLFAEQATSRRAVNRGTAGGSNDKAATEAAAAPAADTGAPRGPSPSATTSFDGGGGTTPTSARSGLDPSTLDAILRAGDGSDPQARLQSIERAEAELSHLTDSLLRRAGQLDQRAEALKRQK